MPLPSLHQVFDQFKTEVSNATELLYRIEDNRGALHQPQVDLVFELAFLKMFIAWEQFLENTFVRYVCGAPSLSGKKPMRIISARYLDDALGAVCGDRPYADWASVDVVVDRANRFFDKGEPYATPLQSAAVELVNMKKVRNHIAHHSNKSGEDFAKLLVNIYGFRPKGMTAGRFLRRSLDVGGTQRIQEYAKTLESLAQMIAH
jgi:hypothetical protein